MEDAKIWPVCCGFTLVWVDEYRKIDTTAAKRIYWSSGVCNTLVKFGRRPKLLV